MELAYHCNCAIYIALKFITLKVGLVSHNKYDIANYFYAHTYLGLSLSQTLDQP